MATLLVVDDNARNRYLLRSLLEAHGHTVVEAGDGREALDIARGDPPDCVISDILMPVMDGFALCREWVRDEVLGRAPFVVHTATYTDARDEELAMGLGAARYVPRPVEPEALLAVIEEVLTAAARGEVRPAVTGDEARLLRLYNERLVAKLERKMQQLEQANRELERRVAERDGANAELAGSRRELRAVAARLAAAAEEERRRIAMELDDSVAQDLSAVGINLALLRNELPPD